MSSATRRGAGLRAILAVGPGRVIGRADGSLPWRIRADLTHFADVTAGHCLIVGRTTFDGLPALPGRRLVVVTHRPSEVHVDGERVIEAAATPELALAVAAGVDSAPILAGGASLYAALWSRVRCVWWTTVDRPVPARPDDVLLPDGVSTRGFRVTETRALTDGVLATRWEREA